MKGLPDIKIEIPLGVGASLLVFWLFWKLADAVGLIYMGFPIHLFFLLYFGGAMLILNEMIKSERGGKDL